MRVNLNTIDHHVKGADFTMSVAEFLIVREALKMFAANEDYNECDRKYAKRILKDIRYEIDRCR
jgi:hypothetical protein